MSQQQFLRLFVVLAMLLGLAVPTTILGVHLHRRSILRQAREEAQRMESDALLLRAEGLLYSAEKRSGGCDTADLNDLRTRIIVFQKDAVGHALQLDDAVKRLDSALRRCDELREAELAAVEAQRRAELDAWRAAEWRFYELLDECDFSFCDAYVRKAYGEFPDHAEAIDRWSTRLQERRELWSRTVAWLESLSVRFQDWKIVLAEHFLSCPGCAGTGLVVCPTCTGTSWMEVTRPCSRNCRHGRIGCPECDGSGKYLCPECAGFGYKEMLRYSSSGGALLLPEKYNEICRTCGGAKKLPCAACKGGAIKDFQCPVCLGKGTIQHRLLCSQCRKGKAPCLRCAGDGRWHRADDLP